MEEFVLKLNLALIDRAKFYHHKRDFTPLCELLGVLETINSMALKELEFDGEDEEIKIGLKEVLETLLDGEGIKLD